MQRIYQLSYKIQVAGGNKSSRVNNTQDETSFHNAMTRNDIRLEKAKSALPVGYARLRALSDWPWRRRVRRLLVHWGVN